MFEIVDDGRTPDHGFTISSPKSLGLGELKKLTSLVVAEEKKIQVTSFLFKSLSSLFKK